jgi:hypothetical protein
MPGIEAERFEFPSLAWLAAMPEAALEGICQVASAVVADMSSAGDELLSAQASGECYRPARVIRWLLKSAK